MVTTAPDIVIQPGPTSCGDVSSSWLTPEIIETVMTYVRDHKGATDYDVVKALADHPSVYVAGTISHLILMSEGRLKRRYGVLSAVESEHERRKRKP